MSFIDSPLLFTPNKATKIRVNERKGKNGRRFDLASIDDLNSRIQAIKAKFERPKRVKKLRTRQSNGYAARMCLSNERRICELPVTSFKAQNYLKHAGLIQKYDHIVTRVKKQAFSGFVSPKRLQETIQKHRETLRKDPNSALMPQVSDKLRMLSPEPVRPHRKLLGSVSKLEPNSNESINCFLNKYKAELKSIKLR